MEHLVIRYQVTDGFTYWFYDTLPVKYESAEAFIVHFEENCKKAKTDGNGEFWVGRTKFTTWNFFDEGEYTPPEIMTIDEWFEKHGD